MHVSCCSVIMNRATISLVIYSYLLGLSGSEEFKGCAKSFMTGKIKCDSTDQRMFIQKGHLLNQGCKTTDTTMYDVNPPSEGEITNHLRKICYLKTECIFQIDVMRYTMSEEHQYIVQISCDWLSPWTPIIQAKPGQNLEASGNQFVLQSSHYPEEQHSTDIYCDIYQPEQKSVSVLVNDLYPESDNLRPCLKTSPSTFSCVKHGYLITIGWHGSISIQAGKSDTYRFSLIIQASEAGRANWRLPNHLFKINCINVSMERTVQDSTQTVNDNGMSSTTKPNFVPTMAPAPAAYPTTAIDVTSTSEQTTSLLNMTKPVNTPTGNKKTFLGAVIGASIGGVLVGAVGIAVYFLWKRNQMKKKSLEEQSTQPEVIASMTTGAIGNNYVMPPDKKNSEVSYELVGATYVNDVDNGPPIHPYSTTHANATLDHFEVNGDMYTTPGVVASKKSIKPPIAKKPNLPSKEPTRAAYTATDEDSDVDDVEIEDNVMYKTV